MSNQTSLLTLLASACEKHFNTAEPNIASLHYELDRLVRIDSDAMETLIRVRVSKASALNRQCWPGDRS